MGGKIPGRFGFPPVARMHARAEFERVMKEGRSHAGQNVVIFSLAAPGLTRKVGIVCGRRVGKAHDRNRVKRRLREVFRNEPALFRDGFWFVVIAKPQIKNLSYSLLREEVTNALSSLVGRGR